MEVRQNASKLHHDKVTSLKIAALTFSILLTMGAASATNLNNIESINPTGTNQINVTGELNMEGNPIRNFFGSQCNNGNVAVHVNDDGTLDCVDATGEVQDDFVDRSGDTMTGTLDMQSSGDINSVENLNVDTINSNRGNNDILFHQGFTVDGDDGGDGSVTLETGPLNMNGNSINNADWSDANDLNSGGGINDFSNANDLSNGGSISDFSAANDLTSGGGISDFSNANDLDGNGNIADFSAANDLDGNGNVNHGLGATLNDGNSANQNIDMSGNNVENLHRIGDPGQNNYIDFTQSSNWLEIQDESGSREEIVTQDVYVNEDGVWLGSHIGDSDAHHVKTTDTNAATQCSGNDYLAGDGTCNFDSTEDYHDLGNVLADGNSVNSGQTIDASSGAFRLPVGADAY